MSTSSAQLERLIETAGGRLDGARRELFADFAARFLLGLDAHPAGGESMLATLALEAFEWASRRAPGELKVRAHDPEDRPGRTVVEILQEDRAFIVDSLRIALARLGVQERIVIHPVMHVQRDAEGQLLSVRAPRNSEPSESYVYVEFAPPLERVRLAEVEKTIREVMGWVADVTRDHRRMILALREFMAHLEYTGPSIAGGAERVARVESFLDWIIDGRFIFVGMRRYRVEREDETFEVCAVPGTGFGMWRDDASSRLVKPRRGADIPEEIHDDLEDSRIIVISKSHLESRIHRSRRLDRILVKEHDDQGRLIGFVILVGLFTLRVLRTPGSQVPLLSERLAEILKRMGVPYGSHRHKSVLAAFDSAPVEVLIGADVDALDALLTELVEAAVSKRVRLVLRLHPRGRALYAAVLLPREHYREELRGEIRALLEERTGAVYIDDRTSFLDEDTAMVNCFCTPGEGRRLQAEAAELEEAIRLVCSSWQDQLLDAVRRAYGDAEAPELGARYETAFPEALRDRTHPIDAVRDVQALEALAETGLPQFALYFAHGDEERATATLRIYLTEPPLLSDIVFVADHFGIRVVDAQLARVEPAGRPAAAVESWRILPLGASQEDLDAIAPRLSEALAAAILGHVSSDSLNGLVLGAGLDWREIDLLRAYVEYFVQIQGPLSRPFLRRVLLENPLAVRLLVRYFQARHDPALGEAERGRLEEKLRASFDTYRDRISSLNEDRALAGLSNLVEATLRTSFFAPRTSPHRIVFKLASDRIQELSGVVPHREIVVHSAHLLGIHLRGGPVARGGLRWSDRADDLRVEILGLMTTQMLKNGLIVPNGAKGGFVLRRAGLSPNEARALADEQYRVFVTSLLDVTDNLDPDGHVVPPSGVRRLDGDDPYLVVAADKGTSHLSDTANEIAVARDFWLGDAFASGGSEGYDHKKYGITAQGAWECVKHHFAELGIDPERDSYSVVGIGDMSGDVFGNGILLARRARLLAAFDHRHVFLDPDPDPDVAWEERKRLFALPRSSWADYRADRISAGGGVHPRNSKRIPVPASLRGPLGIEGETADGQTLVRAILGLEVDLLWNGGIGTYVKASFESHAEAGDRANDAVRIDAPQLRARVVGEGGNLGLTQAARVEAALRGVRLETDAIDNSAGVDLSDHEVNFKIALAPLVRSGQLSAQRRRALLSEVADDACKSALAHNRSQVRSISLDELRSRHDPERFVRAVESLCEAAQLAPAELGLPDATTVRDRATRGLGFTRPELAVLLGLAKLQAQTEIGQSALHDGATADPIFLSYFPERFREELGQSLGAHPLRREITALCLVNRLVDAGGATLFPSLTHELGVDFARAATAMLQAEEVLRAPAYRRRLLEWVGSSRPGVHQALVELEAGVGEVARFLTHCEPTEHDTGWVDRRRSGLDALRAALSDYLSEGETLRLGERRARLEAQGLPPDLAAELAALALADRGLSILLVCDHVAVPPIDVARAYAQLGDATGINWVYARLSQADGASVWESMVLIDLRWEMLELQRQITTSLLRRKPDDLDGAVADYLAEHAERIERVRDLQRRASPASPSALSVIASELRDLRPVEIELHG
jgi:glutamate dehydrogenase